MMQDTVATTHSPESQADKPLSPFDSPSSIITASTDFDDFDYSSDVEPYNFVRGEVALWRAVITQALMDASNGSKKAEAVYDKQQALIWLTRRSNDFDTVCYYAGLSPAYVRLKAQLALSRNCKWRDDHKSGAPLHGTLEFN